VKADDSEGRRWYREAKREVRNGENRKVRGGESGNRSGRWGGDKAEEKGYGWGLRNRDVRGGKRGRCVQSREEIVVGGVNREGGENKPRQKKGEGRAEENGRGGVWRR